MHTLSMHDDFTIVMVKEVRSATTPIVMPTMEVTLVGETLGTLIA